MNEVFTHTKHPTFLLKLASLVYAYLLLFFSPIFLLLCLRSLCCSLIQSQSRDFFFFFCFIDILYLIRSEHGTEEAQQPHLRLTIEKVSSERREKLDQTANVRERSGETVEKLSRLIIQPRVTHLSMGRRKKRKLSGAVGLRNARKFICCVEPFVIAFIISASSHVFVPNRNVDLRI